MRKHVTSAYKDGYKWVVYCIHCSLEDDYLKAEPVCIGRYVSPLKDIKIIQEREEKIDRLKEIF